MPKAGEIRMNSNRHDLNVAVRWLLVEVKREPGPGTVLGGPEPDRRAELMALTRLLSKAAARRRCAGSSVFTINIPRKLAEAFIAAGQSAALAGFRGASVRLPDGILLSLRMALAGRKGRRRVEADDLSERLAPEYVMIEVRQRWRLQARARRDAAWRSWAEETRMRGQTLLTASIPSPKI